MKNTTLLNAYESNPINLKWMNGFPPENDKIVSAADGTFFDFPALRYSVNHMREFYPTRNVPASKHSLYHHKVKLDDKIDEVKFIPWDSPSAITWKESLDKNYTDGIIIVHKDKIVYEKYFAGLTQQGLHSAMSVSKSFTGLLASILIAEREIEPCKLVTDYLPELKKSGFAEATVQQVLDMTTAIQYSEDYTDPKAEIWEFSEAGNPFRPEKYKGPKNYYEYLQTVKKEHGNEHGKLFGYKTINTEVMGWLISRVTGKCITELLSQKIWIPLGTTYDAYYQVDPSGKAFAGGGLNLNLRDMALFGMMILNKGKINDTQIIPEKAAIEISKGGSKEAFEKSKEYPKLTNWSYHNMWWITNNANGAFMARGVHGQAIYIDPTAQMVIVRFASHPLSSNKLLDPLSIPAYQAIASYLISKEN